MAAFSSAAQLRRRPAPVNTSTRRARSDTCISSEIDIGRSSKPAPNIIPFTPGAGRCSPDDAYHEVVEETSNEIPAVQTLIETLGLTGRVFTIDAMHCQKNIRDRQGDGQ